MCELKRDLEEFGDWGVGSGMVNLDLESFRGKRKGKESESWEMHGVQVPCDLVSPALYRLILSQLSAPVDATLTTLDCMVYLFIYDAIGCPGWSISGYRG